MLDVAGWVRAGRQKHLACDIFHAACATVFDETLFSLRYNWFVQVDKNIR